MTRRSARAAFLVLFGLLAVALGGYYWWRLQHGPTGRLILQQVSFKDLEDWSSNDPRAAIEAFRGSCERLLQLRADQKLSGSGYAGTAADWTTVCKRVPAVTTPSTARHWFEENFVPLAVGQGTSHEGLFTGYYEPELQGSRTNHGRFRTPVYGVPDDLIEVDLGEFPGSRSDERIAGRLDGRRLVPYATRAEIDKFGLSRAPVLFFADDPAAVFFLHIQGSGRVRFEDGRMERVAYAAQNGWPYTPVGRALIEERQIAREKASMQTIRAWLDEHPQEERAVMERDRSFVFFKELPLGDPRLGSPGAEGVALTPNASIAVDQRIHPLGAPFYIAASEPDPDASRPERALRRLFVAQDIGGAIRGPVRADLFFGYGRDAESMAGRMKATGRLYVLVPKAIATQAVAANV
jgi:membrane-bound lytic murein transglycosylase A